MKNSFQIILISILLISASINLFGQDKYYTNGLANGYAWTASHSASMLAYTKGESLSRMLNRKKYQTEEQRDASFPLGCEDEVEQLLKSNATSNIDLQTIENMIDEFYVNEDNLIIPVLGAYCCSIKKLAELNADEIEAYRKKLFEFSTE